MLDVVFSTPVTSVKLNSCYFYAFTETTNLRCASVTFAALLFVRGCIEQPRLDDAVSICTLIVLYTSVHEQLKIHLPDLHTAQHHVSAGANRPTEAWLDRSLV